jgi:hypothetical protein
MEFLSHTPPSMPDGSLKPSSWKRSRFGGRDRAPSISGRLRSASDLVEGGVISDLQKGTLKDMIISNDPRVDEALRMADEGNFQQLQQVLTAAKDKPRRSSMDLVNDLGLDQLDLNFFDMGSLPKPSPPASHRSSSPPPSESSATAQFQFDDDMWDILDTAAGNEMSSSVGKEGTSFNAGSMGGGGMSWGDNRHSGGSHIGGRQRLPSQSGSFSTFFGMTPPMDSTMEMYGNSPNSQLAMSMDQSTAEALSGGSGKGGSNGIAFSKTGGGSVSINLNHQSGLSKMMAKQTSSIPSNNNTAPMAIPKRAATPVQLGPDGKPIKKMVGDYSPESRRARIARYVYDDDDSNGDNGGSGDDDVISNEELFFPLSLSPSPFPSPSPSPSPPPIIVTNPFLSSPPPSTKTNILSPCSFCRYT